MRLFDTHAHLDLPPFGDEAERLDVVDRAIRAGIRDILIPGVDPGGWRHLLGVASALAAKRSSVRIHTSIGIHPRAEGDLNRDPEAAVLDRLRAAIATRPVGLVALGECGLDFGARGRHVPRERQVAVFKAHLTLARETGLPLILHCVRAHDELRALLCERPTPASVLHSFSGSGELAKLFCRAGHYISLSGAITLPGARKPIAVARAVPEDRLLIETDCPDQTPAPRRHETRIVRNEPAFLLDVADSVAQARGATIDHIAAITWANAYRLLGLADADARG